MPRITLQGLLRSGAAKRVSYRDSNAPEILPDKEKREAIAQIAMEKLKLPREKVGQAIDDLMAYKRLRFESMIAYRFRDGYCLTRYNAFPGIWGKRYQIFLFKGPRTAVIFRKIYDALAAIPAKLTKVAEN